jgi:hypothetical protein
MISSSDEAHEAERKRERVMSAQNNEINRDIDTAEAHIRRTFVEEAEDAGKRLAIRHPEALDDEAEGHIRRSFVEEAEDAGKRLS